MEEDIKEILTALDNTTKKQLDEAIANADKEWSEMELEEDIKILESYTKHDTDLVNLPEYDAKIVNKAIEHLIARNKELEENNCYGCVVKIANEDLENKNKSLKKQIKLMQEYNKKAGIVYKDKIKEKIEELGKQIIDKEEKTDGMCITIGEDTARRILIELLED